MKLISLTREREIACDEFLEVIAEFTEHQLTEKSTKVDLQAIEHHLELCTECREEYESLRRALLNGLNQKPDSSES